MTEYSMTPYAFSLSPRYARGGERRPIGDVDGEGAALKPIIDGVLESFEGDRLHVDADDDSRSLRVNRLYAYDLFTFVEFGIGRAGYVGTVHQRAGTRVSYDADEPNETLIRGVFVFPEGAHEAYWLSERAGISTAYSFMDERFLTAIRARFPDLTAKLQPVADWAAVRAWAQNVLVQEIRFDAPRAGGSTQAIDVNGMHADIRITVKPRGVTLNRLIDANGPKKDDVYGFLSHAPLIEASTESIIGQGWRARVAFKNPAGRQRSFGVHTEEAGPTLVYPVGSQGAGQSRAYRPTDRQFAQSCADFLLDVEGRLPVGTTVADAILDRIT